MTRPVRRPVILVIDDQPDILALYARVLDRAGYASQVAFTAEAALALLRMTPPDAVVVDLYMPYINGMGMLYRVRELSPQMPVAVITGAADVDHHTVEEIASLGATLHFKPLSAAQLQQVADSLVRSSAAGRLVPALRAGRAVAPPSSLGTLTTSADRISGPPGS